jgi:hypothetical protein
VERHVGAIDRGAGAAWDLSGERTDAPCNLGSIASNATGKDSR